MGSIVVKTLRGRGGRRGDGQRLGSFALGFTLANQVMKGIAGAAMVKIQAALDAEMDGAEAAIREHIEGSGQGLVGGKRRVGAVGAGDFGVVGLLLDLVQAVL